MLSFCHILATFRLSVMMMLPHTNGGVKDEYALNSAEREDLYNFDEIEIYDCHLAPGGFTLEH